MFLSVVVPSCGVGRCLFASLYVFTGVVFIVHWLLLFVADFDIQAVESGSSVELLIARTSLMAYSYGHKSHLWTSTWLCRLPHILYRFYAIDSVLKSIRICLRSLILVLLVYSCVFAGALLWASLDALLYTHT